MSEPPSPVPMACQLVPGLGLTGPPPTKAFPFISQTETWPVLLFWKRMSSEKPSWVKSPVPIACQAGPGLGLTGPPPISLLSFISQIEVWPVLLFWKRLWEKPSWLKSPVPIACQAGPGLGLTGPPPIKLLPFISQIEVWPVLLFWKRMSEKPSWLKSPVPIACQLGPGFGLTGPPPIKVFPLISQIETWPVLVFWKKDVGKAVAIEVARSDCLPGRPWIGTDRPAADQAVPAHFPDRDLAAARILPQDVVGKAVVSEIAGSDRFPGSPGIGCHRAAAAQAV